jgi:hypothetical protein
MELQQKYVDMGKTKELRKFCPSASLSMTYPIWTDLGMNPGLFVVTGW